MDSKPQSNLWTVKQAAITAVICFAIGIAIGYIGHGPNIAERANTPVPAVAAMPQQAPSQQAIAPPISNPAPSPEQLKAASKQAAMPLQEQAPPISNPAPSPEQLKAASKQAAMPLQEQLKKNPKDFKLLVQAGEMYYHHGAYADAASFYKRALAVEENAAVRNQYASTLYYQGDADGALRQYSQVLNKDNKNQIALLNTGMIRYKSKNDAKGAIEPWETFLKEYPKDPRSAQVQTLVNQAKAKN